MNQPLEAHIPLHKATAAQLASLRVSQSSTTGLAGNRLRFRVENETGGEPVLWLTTAAPVKEPALSFVLEFAWDGGQLSREYSILLDPR
jgi:pilus assembly protein FimV